MGLTECGSGTSVDRRLGVHGAEGVEKALVMLVQICHDDGKVEEEDAYASMLYDILESKKVAVGEEGTNEPTPVIEATEATAESEPSATVKPNEADAAAFGDDAVPAPTKEEHPKDSEAADEATPASEGLLGYKSPSFIP